MTRLPGCRTVFSTASLNFTTVKFLDRRPFIHHFQDHSSYPLSLVSSYLPTLLIWFTLSVCLVLIVFHDRAVFIHRLICKEENAFLETDRPKKRLMTLLRDTQANSIPQGLFLSFV